MLCQEVLPPPQAATGWLRKYAKLRLWLHLQRLEEVAGAIDERSGLSVCACDSVSFAVEPEYTSPRQARLVSCQQQGPRSLPTFEQVPRYLQKTVQPSASCRRTWKQHWQLESLEECSVPGACKAEA